MDITLVTKPTHTTLFPPSPYQAKTTTLSDRFLEASPQKAVLKHPHHSASDWDFLVVDDWSNFTGWSLYAPYHVSPPTSLLLNPWSWQAEVYALSKHSRLQNLKAGSIRSWCQRAAYGLGQAHAHIGVTGPGSSGIALELVTVTGEFRRSRYDWWQGFDLSGDPATLVAQYNWNDPDWTFVTLTYHPPMTGSLNRVGIGCTTQSLGRAKWYDDTEIWTPT